MPLPYKEVCVNTNFVFPGIISTKTCTHIHILISKTSTVWFSVSKSREGELNTNHKVEKGVAIVVQGMQKTCKMHLKTPCPLCLPKQTLMSLTWCKVYIRIRMKPSSSIFAQTTIQECKASGWQFWYGRNKTKFQSSRTPSRRGKQVIRLGSYIYPHRVYLYKQHRRSHIYVIEVHC